MLERTNKFNYKPVVIGCESFDLEMKKKLYVSQFLDINIYTDSNDLQKNILMAGGRSIDLIKSEPTASLYYFVREKLPFTKKGELPLIEMSLDYPGDIYMSFDMKSFYFKGVEKFGTLISMLYGIHSFFSIDKGILGIHSALLYDNEKQLSHLIVGGNRTGKSAVGRTVENISGKFDLIADDWSEIDLLSQSFELTPVSTTFSPDAISENYKYAFTSFGKSFYFKNKFRPTPVYRLGKIIELCRDKKEADSENFVLKALTHIPLINQNFSEEDFCCSSRIKDGIVNKVINKKRAILLSYQWLISQKPVYRIINNPENNSIEETSKEILNILNL